MKKLLALLFLALFSSAAAAQSVQQSPSFVTPGHAAYWVTNGVIGDAGPAQVPVLSSIGTVGPGSTICANSGVNTGPYNQLCLAANPTSAAQIILQNFGGAAAQNLQFVINGTAYSFPFIATGVIGPASTTAGDVACWNSTVGTVLSDCGLQVTASSTTTFTNKTLTSATNSFGGVTAAFGSDAKGDIYTNGGSSNVVTRLGIGTTGQCLVVTAGLPAWSTCTVLTVNTTTISGGSAGNLLYTDGTKLQASGGITWVGTGQLVAALGTITTNLSALSITGTFNAGVTFDAPLLVNITNTSSTYGSAIADVQLASTSIFKVVPGAASGGGVNQSQVRVAAGSVLLGDGPGLAFAGSTANYASSGFGFNDGGGVNQNLAVWVAGIITLNLTSAANGASYRIPSNYTFNWASTTTNNAAPDTGLSRDSAAVVDVGNGTGGDSSGTIKAAHATLTTLANSATTSAVCYNVGSGVLTYDGTIGTCNTSTMRVKHNIVPLQINALDGIMAMRPVSFYYNDEQHTPGQQLGLIAEDLAKIDPRLVNFDVDGQPNAIRFLGPLHAYEIGAIQELAARISALEKRLSP